MRDREITGAPLFSAVVQIFCTDAIFLPFRSPACTAIPVKSSLIIGHYTSKTLENKYEGKQPLAVKAGEVLSPHVVKNVGGGNAADLATSPKVKPLIAVARIL
jgi:hypothetical protein